MPENFNMPNEGPIWKSPRLSFLFPSTLEKNIYEHAASLPRSLEAAAGDPAATNGRPHSRRSSDEFSSAPPSLQRSNGSIDGLSAQSGLQRSIDELRQSQAAHQRSVQGIMEQVLQLLSPTASSEQSLWVFVELEMAGIRDELNRLKACIEPRKEESYKDPSRASALTQSSGPARMPHSSGLKEDDHSFQSFIQQELQLVKASMISEVQASKVECLANVESLRKVLEQPGNRDKTKLEEGQVPEVRDGKELAREDVLWDQLQDATEEMDMEHHLYSPVMARYRVSGSVWHDLFSYFGSSALLDVRSPSTALAKAVERPCFIMIQTILILANTAIIGYEADAGIKAALEEPPGKVAEWINSCNMIFTIIFLLELIFRMIALRSWFFVAPYEWGWNAFDVLVVGLSLLVDFALIGVNWKFMRTIRIVRAVRVVRVIRVLRFFRELRKMLFAILASLSSLMWFFLFVTMILFMFSILLLQGLTFALNDMPSDSEGQQVNGMPLRAMIKEWYGSIDSSMFTLVCAVTGGADWAFLREPLVGAGRFYTFAFLIYILFVTVGIVNVLTGIFVSCSAELIDESLIILNEQMRIDGFVRQMMAIFKELDKSGTGKIAWPDFKEAMKEERLQAYLSSHDLEPTHARLIFDLLDVKNTGTVDITEFVMGILRLKGEAKAIDARTIQRQMSLLPKLLDRNFKAVAALHAERRDSDI